MKQTTFDTTKRTLGWVFCTLLLLHVCCVVGGQQKCLRDPDCPPAFPKCQGGVCVGCRSAADCAPNALCIDGTCSSSQVEKSPESPTQDAPPQENSNPTEQDPTKDAGNLEMGPDIPASPDQPSSENTPETLQEEPSNPPETTPETNPDLGERCPVGSSRPCYAGDPTTRGKGECKDGTQRCQNGGNWGPCQGLVLPIAEECDGKDNDCDGKIDEDFPLKGTSCVGGVGACRTTGTYLCGSNLYHLRCDAVAGTSQNEKCGDLIDNNCDGRVDNGCSCKAGTTQPCGSDVGECTSGTQKCLSTGLGTYQWGACSNNKGPSPEICDGKDNDCDGQIDEDCCIPSQPLTSWQAHGPANLSSITGIAYIPNKQFWITSAHDATLKQWEAQKNPINLRKTITQPDAITALVASEQGRWIAAGTQSGQVSLWNDGGNLRRSWSGHTGRIATVALVSQNPAKPDESVFVLSGGEDQVIRIWNDNQSTPNAVLLGHSGTIESIRVNPTQTLFASASQDKTIRIWDITGTAIRTLQGHTAAVLDLVWDAKGTQLFSISQDRTLRRWDTATGKLIQTLYTAPVGEIPSRIVQVSGDSWLALLFLKPAKIRFFDTKTYTLRQEVPIPFAPSGAIIWAPELARLAIGEANGLVHLWKCP